MNSQQIKEILLSEIHEVSINYEKYCNNPKRDFSRKRKLPFELMLKNIIGMGSKSITNELINIFQASGECRLHRHLCSSAQKSDQRH